MIDQEKANISPLISLFRLARVYCSKQKDYGKAERKSYVSGIGRDHEVGNQAMEGRKHGSGQSRNPV